MENFSFPFFGPKTTRLPLSPRKPVKTLTLEERVNVIMMGSRGVSARKIAQQLGVGKTQIQNILHRKELILEDYRNNVPYNRKRRIRKTANEEINEVCWKWFQNTTGLGINVTGPMLKEKAMHLAREFDRPNFKASNGWLESFTKRNKIAFGRGKPSEETREADFVQSQKLVMPLSQPPTEDQSFMQHRPSPYSMMHLPGPVSDAEQCGSSQQLQKQVASPSDIQLKSHLVGGKIGSKRSRKAVVGLETANSSKEQAVGGLPEQTSISQTYVVRNHHSHVFSNLSQLWKNGKLCDAAMVNGNATVMMHKVVLIAVSPHLLTLSNPDVLKGNFFQVTLPKEVGEKAMWAFAKYIYEGILTLDNNTVEDMERIAKLFVLQDLLNLCDQYRNDLSARLTKNHLSLSSSNVREVDANYSDQIPMQQPIPDIDSLNNIGLLDLPPGGVKQEPIDTTDIQNCQLRLTCSDNMQSGLTISGSHATAETYWSGNGNSAESLPSVELLENSVQNIKQEPLNSEWYNQNAKTNPGSTETYVTYTSKQLSELHSAGTPLQSPSQRGVKKTRRKLSASVLKMQSSQQQQLGGGNVKRTASLAMPSSSNCETHVNLNFSDGDVGSTKAYLPYPVSLMSAEGQSIPLPVPSLENPVECENIKHRSKRKRLS